MSAAALAALKEALGEIYWYKRDLRNFVAQCVTDRGVVSQVDWSGPKRRALDELWDILATDQGRHLGDLRRLLAEVVKMESFPHLKRLEDGAMKAARAKVAVDALRALVAVHDRAVKETDAVEARRAREKATVSKVKTFRDQLDDLRQRYGELLIMAPQARGYALETLLHDLFRVFDLDPRASFRNPGEQIDGAFTLDGTDYLFEAKWQDAFVAGADLDAFESKVKRKLDNTLGLFLSINGFAVDAVGLYTQRRPVMLLMTGRDLTAVLEQRVDFTSLLQRKRRHAAQTGSILHEPF